MKNDRQPFRLSRSPQALLRGGLAGALALAFVIVLAGRGPLHGGYEPQTGDIVFQSLAKMDLVIAIEGVTESPWSHCGVVFEKDGNWLVAEAIGPVRITPLDRFLQRSRGKRFAVYRLKPEHRPHIPAFLEAIKPFMGRPYDIRYRMDDQYIYCSELIYKAWKKATGEELGKLQRFGDLNWEPYRATIEKYEGGPPPLDVMMITPRGVSEAEQLEKVFDHPAPKSKKKAK